MLGFPERVCCRARTDFQCFGGIVELENVCVRVSYLQSPPLLVHEIPWSGIRSPEGVTLAF